jgi:hypothetical protein
MTDEGNTRETLLGLVALIADRNRVDQQIAQVVGRPGERDHVGLRCATCSGGPILASTMLEVRRPN